MQILHKCSQLIRKKKTIVFTPTFQKIPSTSSSLMTFPPSFTTWKPCWPLTSSSDQILISKQTPLLPPAKLFRQSKWISEENTPLNCLPGWGSFAYENDSKTGFTRRSFAISVYYGLQACVASRKKKNPLSPFFSPSLHGFEFRVFLNHRFFWNIVCWGGEVKQRRRSRFYAIMFHSLNVKGRVIDMKGQWIGDKWAFDDHLFLPFPNILRILAILSNPFSLSLPPTPSFQRKSL